MFKSQEIRNLIDENVNEALDMKNNNSVFPSRKELIQKFKNLAEDIKKVTTKSSYWGIEDEMFKKMISDRKNENDSIKMSEEKYYTKFDL